MADSSRAVSGTIHTIAESAPRVAFDLMVLIEGRTSDRVTTEPKDRAYYLKLYAQCWDVAHGGSPK